MYIGITFRGLFGVFPPKKPCPHFTAVCLVDVNVFSSILADFQYPSPRENVFQTAEHSNMSKKRAGIIPVSETLGKNRGRCLCFVHKWENLCLFPSWCLIELQSRSSGSLTQREMIWPFLSDHWSLWYPKSFCVYVFDHYYYRGSLNSLPLLPLQTTGEPFIMGKANPYSWPKVSCLSASE